MKRKYLDDMGVSYRPDNWHGSDERQEKWKKERKTYGFDERETWNLNYSFRLWLYERLKMYLEVSFLDLDYHTFKFKGDKYTQRQMIDMILERLEFSFEDDYNDWDTKQSKYVNEIGHLWAKVMPAMWW